MSKIPLLNPEKSEKAESSTNNHAREKYYTKASMQIILKGPVHTILI